MGQILKVTMQSLRTFANAIDAKGPHTNGHSVRVARYSREITRRMGCSENDQESVVPVETPGREPTA